MAEFMDDEADVTSEEDEEALADEDDEDEVTTPRKKSVKKKKRTAQIDDDDEDEGEDEVDDEVREQLADFIQDDPIEEETVEDEDRKRKRSDDEADEDLEEDDYDLIEENMGIKVKRGPKFRRVRALEGGESDEEANDRDVIANQLFEDDLDEDAPPTKMPPKRPTDGHAPRPRDEDLGDVDEEENSDEDSFIVDDEGKPIHGSKQRGARRYDDAALQEAQDIFGLDFDVEDLEEVDDEYDEEGEYEEEDDDGEVIRHTRRKKNRKSVMEVYEPSDLEHNLKTQADNAIRLADQPERFQLRSIPVEAPVPLEKAATELLEEARWIHKQLFEESTLSNQLKAQKILREMAGPPSAAVAKTTVAPPTDEFSGGSSGAFSGAFSGGWGKQESALKAASSFDANNIEARVLKIKEILDFIRIQSLEDRFIATYRKESFEPDFNGEDIHDIYERDLMWMQLQRRRVNLVKLMVKMQDYLRKGVLKKEHPDEFEEGDEITDDEIDLVRNAQTTVELADLFSEFRMIYGRHLGNLHKSDAAVVKKQSIKGEGRKAESTLDENGMPVEVEGDDETTRVETDLATAGGEGAEGREGAEGGVVTKRASRTDPYSLYKQAGLDKFVEKFGLSAEKLAVNVEGMFMINEIEQEPVDPEILAEQFTTQRCPTAADVLKGGVSMMAWLIARNAHFRRVARQFFLRNATLLVQATARGLKEIDENHTCYAVKWLKDKPIGDLMDDQYLKIFQAKKEGLLEVKIRIGLDETTGKDKFLTSVTPLLSVDEFTKEVTAWNDLRTKALEKAMSSHLYPAFEKEVHEQLLTESKFFVKAEIRRKLYTSLYVAPFVTSLEKQAKEDNWEDGPWDLSDGVRVMGIAYEDVRDAPGYAVVVNCYGEVLDFVKLPTIMKMGGAQRVAQEDVDRMMRLFRDKKPHVIAVASETRKCLDIRDALKRGVEQVRFEDRSGSHETQVEIVDNLLSIVYQNSECGRMEFPSNSAVFRQAISLARRLLDPLMTFAQLFNMDDDILNLNFHPLQSELSKEEFRNALQTEFVRRVNDVGVDLNECVSHPLTHGNVVQFVCGLGPRKAQNLLKLVKQNGVIVSRNQLVLQYRLGPKVFVNCAGFVKINVDELSDAVTGEQYVEPLDASRVHPEHYEWARKMAVDALDFDDSAEGANPSDALQEILEKPDKLEQLDLEAFNDELMRHDYGSKHITLLEISRELCERFRETRPLYRSPTEEQLFEMIVGEGVAEYRAGRLLAPTVTGFYFRMPQFPGAGPGGEQLTVRKVGGCDDWYCPQCRQRGFLQPDLVYKHMEGAGGAGGECPGNLMTVKVYLDNGIGGNIQLEYLSDKQPVEIPQDRVKKGMIVHARLLEDVDPSRFLGKFTCRSSDLLDKANLFRPPKDRFYDLGAETVAVEKEVKKRSKLAPKTNFLKRVIAHPAFKNINFEEAEKYLNGQTVEAGDAVIRPSSKGNNKLTLSWKVSQAIHDHVEISERDKENAFSLGRRLMIEDEEYDDLDEILARYVQPMAQLVNDLVQHKYHVDSHNGQSVDRPTQRHALDRWLREQKNAMPNRIPFCFSECVTAPRRFFLCHLPRDTVREEFITVTPQGYTYRRQNFTTLNHLIKYFKDHFHEPPPAPLGTTPHASVTPGSAMMTGATPRFGSTNLAALTQAFHTLPPAVLERLKEAGGSTNRATPNVFATPRTPSGSTYNPSNILASVGTPSGATPSSTPSAAPWGRAAQMWQKAMTGQVVTPGTPASVPPTPASMTGNPGNPGNPTNWAAAAAAWVTGNTAPAAPPADK